MRGGRSAALDIVKGLAILAVLAQHTIPGETLREVGRNLWIRPAVPVFFLIAGLNLARSLARPEPTWRQAGGQVLRRLDRVLAPLAVVAAVLVIAAALRDELTWKSSYLLGGLPLDPPGNYFVTALIGILVLSPVLLWCYRRRPGLTVLGLVLVDLATEVLLLEAGGVADRLRGDGMVGYWFPANPLRYLAAVAVGFWLARDPRLTAARNRWLLVLAVPSGAFLLALDLGHEPLGWYPDSFEKAMSLFAVPWAALLVLAGLRFLPQDARSVPARLLAEAGKASYQIYVVQMAWLAIVADKTKDSAEAPLHFAACLALGWVLYRLLPDGVLRERRPGGGPTGTARAAAAGSGTPAAAATDRPAG